MTIERYEREKVSLDISMKDKTIEEQARIWSEAYLSLGEIDCDNLPKALVLIDPVYRFTWEGEEIKLRRGTFEKISHHEKCESAAVLGHDCPWNKHPEIRGRLEPDHHWPESLGGPTEPRNRLVLCRVHNLAKSNDISRYSWDSNPVWLPTLLEEIHTRKMWGFSER